MCRIESVGAGSSSQSLVTLGKNVRTLTFASFSQVIGEIALDRPVHSVDYTSGGNMLAVAGCGTKLKTAKIS